MKQEGINKNIEKALQYLIHSLKLYDEDIFEIGEKKEKRIVRIIKFFYKEDDKKVYIRIAKLGDRFVKIASTLGENLESTFRIRLDSTNSTVDYFEYVFLKERDKRIDLSSSINNQQKNSDVIQISGNISYKLSKTPHSLIVGGTGSGKSFFILGKNCKLSKSNTTSRIIHCRPQKGKSFFIKVRSKFRG